MNALAVTVHLGGEIGQLLPAFELGAIVERHDDELRRTVDARLCRRGDGAREQQSQCGEEFPQRSFSPPTDSAGGSLADSNRGMDCGQHKLRQCDTESTFQSRSLYAARSRFSATVESELSR